MSRNTTSAPHQINGTSQARIELTPIGEQTMIGQYYTQHKASAAQICAATERNNFGELADLQKTQTQEGGDAAYRNNHSRAATTPSAQAYGMLSPRPNHDHKTPLAQTETTVNKPGPKVIFAEKKGPNPIMTLPFSVMDLGQEDLGGMMRRMASAVALGVDGVAKGVASTINFGANQLKPFANQVKKEFYQNLNIDSIGQLVGLGAQQKQENNPNVLANPLEQVSGIKSNKSMEQFQMAQTVLMKIRAFKKQESGQHQVHQATESGKIETENARHILQRPEVQQILSPQRSMTPGEIMDFRAYQKAMAKQADNFLEEKQKSRKALRQPTTKQPRGQMGVAAARGETSVGTNAMKNVGS